MRPYPDPPKSLTRELQVDGETEDEDGRFHFDRWNDASWNNLMSWNGTRAEIGPSEQTLMRFEDDGGQPAPETERRRENFDPYPYFIMRNFPVAVRR